MTAIELGFLIHAISNIFIDIKDDTMFDLLKKELSNA